MLDDPGFSLNSEQRRRLTHYIILLFHRSEARRGLADHLHQVTVQAVNQFLANERQILTVIAKWTIEQIHSKRGLSERITPELVKNLARRLLRSYGSERSKQAAYSETIERTFAFFDDELYEGEWRLIRTTRNNPFVLSDAPVATWERLEGAESFKFGVGFHEMNVEAFLPLSPRISLHILPKVRRTRGNVQVPKVSEVNAAQAAFASRGCYANIYSEEIDRVIQGNFGKAKLGETAFTLWHRDYSNLVYEVSMQSGEHAGNRP